MKRTIFFFAIILIFTIFFLIGCRVETKTQSDRAREAAVDSVRDFLYDPGDFLKNYKSVRPYFINNTTIIEERPTYFIMKICFPEADECHCEQEYYIVNVSKQDFKATLLEMKQCFYG